MCRNIKPLFNYDPPASDDDVYASSLQYVRKVSGFRTPSQVNIEIFNKTVDEIAQLTKQLIENLKTSSPPRDRAAEIAKAKERSALRFATK